MKLFYFFSTFWFFRQIKSILFWLYLWQLKEYHIGRFIDHFRTEKGKRIFLNKTFLWKIVFLLFFIFAPTLRLTLFWLILFLYFLEFLKFLYDFSKKQILKPIFTSKIVFLFSFNFLFTLFYLFALFQNKEFLIFWLLIFDILSPAIFSGIVLIFQPITFLLRTTVIQKAKKKREKFKDLLVIGICGSYGKTSTKEFLATILEEKFPGKVLKTKEHQNSEIGISKCILEDLKESHKIFVVEMGAYNKGGIKLLCDIVKPKIGIITGVNEQHLATFGSMENLISAEGGKELIESLQEDGLVIFNGENEILRKIYQETRIKKRIVGISKKEFDLWAGNIKVKKEVLFFQTFTKEGEMADFNLNLIGAQNIQNLLLAICAAKELGMSLKEISRAAKKIRKEQSGVRLIKTKDGFNVIDATYSANPDSVISHLEYLKVWPGKRAIIMPCLIELGPASKEIHKKIGEKIYEVCDLAIIVTRDRFKEIKEGAKEKAIFLENVKGIYEKIKQFTGESDIILLEGRLPREFLNLIYGDQGNKR
jgi:UDP-N-acetylmuramoyl-tripeptide--D-alanyl-D-alanine ligase